jgi:hypothetical protein
MDNHGIGHKATEERRIMAFTRDEYNFIFGTATRFYKGKWPESLKDRIGCFENHPKEEQKCSTCRHQREGMNGICGICSHVIMIAELDRWEAIP